MKVILFVTLLIAGVLSETVDDRDKRQLLLGTGGVSNLGGVRIIGAGGVSNLGGVGIIGADGVSTLGGLGPVLTNPSIIGSRIGGGLVAPVSPSVLSLGPHRIGTPLLGRSSLVSTDGRIITSPWVNSPYVL